MAKGKLRKLFTNDDILEAIRASSGSTKKAAKILTDFGRGKVSKQLLTYWKKHLNTKKLNGQPYAGTTVVDRNIRADMSLREPTPNDDDAQGRFVDLVEDNSRIMIIPDQHAPYHHPDAIEFLIAVAAKYKPTRIMNMGDETDGHALSMHDSDPNLDSAGAELHNARIFINDLAKIFPKMDVCHSNHGSLIYRRAFKSGIPLEYIKSYREILFPKGGGDGWNWKSQHRIALPNGETVIFQHQSSGDILNNAAHERASIVQGHEHGKFEIQYRSSTNALYWSMISGCLIDPKALAFAYGKLFPKKPIIGCSLIIDSIPRLVPMEQDSKGRWTGVLRG